MRHESSTSTKAKDETYCTKILIPDQIWMIGVDVTLTLNMWRLLFGKHPIHSQVCVHSIMIWCNTPIPSIFVSTPFAYESEYSFLETCLDIKIMLTCHSHIDHSILSFSNNTYSSSNTCHHRRLISFLVYQHFSMTFFLSINIVWFKSLSKYLDWNW